MSAKKFVAPGKGKKLDEMLDTADGAMTAGCGRASAGIRNQAMRRRKR